MSQQARFVCPVCLATTKTDGNLFTGLRSVTLHVAGKAKGLNDGHRAWVSKTIPGIDIKTSINHMGDQIEFYVSEEIEAEEDGGLGETDLGHSDVPGV